MIKTKRILIFLPILLLLHLFLLIKLQFTAWPEMTLWPYLVNNGWLPYRDIAMAHNPLLIFLLSGFYRVLGLSLLNLKVFTWILILITDVLLYGLMVKLFKKHNLAVICLVFYVLWQVYFEGNGLWFDLMLTPLALLSFYLLWTKKYFWSGLVLGISFLVKQTAVWFLIPVIIQMFLMRPIGKKGPIKLIIGGLIPLLGLLCYLLITNTISDFYYWAINFGIFYLPHASGQVELPTLRQTLQLIVPFAFILPAGYIVYKKKDDWVLIISLVLWFVFASLGVYPRWSLFHFQPGLPFLAIITSLLGLRGAYSLFEARKERSDSSQGSVPKKALISDLSRPLLIILLIALIIGTIYLQIRFFRLNWQKQDRFFENETLETASWLKNNTRTGQKIFILNSWDHLYALSNTLPATRPWVPTLSWYLEYPDVQKGVVDDLKKQMPQFIIFEPYKTQGLGSYEPKEIDKYIKDNYTLKKIVGNRFQILESN